MSGEPTAHWTTEWLETLDGDRLRALASALFSHIGYVVTEIDSEDLDFELSQQAPMAPRVGLSCRSATEGIDIPALKKIDAAVSVNDHGFGIVVKNGSFRPEEKMFAQGKPLQLIDSEEFIKKLSHLPPDVVEALSRDFPPPAPESESSSDAIASTNRGSSSTPDFIKKLENVPGFGNKRPKPTGSVPPSEGTPDPANSESSLAPAPAENKAEPVQGLNLTKSPSGETPTAASQPTSPPSLQPLAQSLPKASPPSPVETAIPLVPEDAQPATEPKSPEIIERPLAQDAAAKATEPKSPEIIERPLAQNAAKTSATEEASSAPSAPDPGLQSTSAPPSESTPPPTAGFGAPSTSPTSPPTEENGSDPEPSPSSEDSKASSDTKPATRAGIELPSDSAAFDQLKSPGSKTDSGAATAPPTSPSQDPTPSGSPAIEASSTPPPIPQGQTSADVQAPPKKNKKKRVPVAALIFIPLLLVPVLGGFFVVKTIFSPKEKVTVAEAATEPVTPTVDPEEIKSLSKSLAARITSLRRVSEELQAREAAVKVAIAGTAAKKSGVDFVPTGNETLLDYIAAVIGGGPSVEFFGQENEEPPAPLELGDVEIESIANYLLLEDGLLKFSMEARTPPAPPGEDEPLAEGEELLLQLQEILNKQQVATARDNAEKIAEIAMAAKDAGLDFTASGRRNVEKTVSAIVEGETVSNYLATGEDAVFSFPNLSGKAERAALAYLTLAEGEVTYVRDPDPAPAPPFDLVGNDIIYDLERGVSICEQAIEHAQGKNGPIEVDVKALAIEQEGILAVTGEPARVTFASGVLTVLLPRDFLYEHESDGSLIITPKYSSNKEAIWLRLRLQPPDSRSKAAGMNGAARLESLAKSLGRPVEKLGDKLFYWKNEEVLEGDLLYWVTERHVGFGDSIVLVADATARGMEELPEAERLQAVLPDIIRSVTETGKQPPSLEAADASDSVSKKPAPPLLPGRTLRR